MLGFVVRRLLWAALLVVVISLFAFVLFFVVPPETTQIGRGIAAEDLSLRGAYGLERSSLPVEYLEFVWAVVGERSLGESFVTHRPVADILGAALPVTLSVVGGGALLFLLVAVPVGILSAVRQRSLFDRLAMLVVLIGVSAHPAWIGLILSYFFGSKWGITPIAGYCDFFNPSLDCGGPREWASHLLLPWATFAALFAALYARMIRATVLETLDEDFVRTARAKGAPRRAVLRSHVLRNAMIPVVTMLGMDVGLAFGGTVFVEQVFGLPGIGRIAVQALARRDLPVIMGVVLTVTVAVALLNMIVDILYAWLDPRVRVGRSRADVEPAEPLRRAREPKALTAPTGVAR